MQIQFEIIYPESISWHILTSFEFFPTFDKNRAKGRLCVCSGVCYVFLSVLLTSPNWNIFFKSTSQELEVEAVFFWQYLLMLKIGF